jgi:ATP-dependent DNA helicase DinG
VESPLDIAEAFSALTKPIVVPNASAPAYEDADAESAQDQAHAWPVEPSAESGKEALVQRAWVFTSATLGDDHTLRWFTEPCGLSSATVLQVSSPFDYARQAAMYVPEHLPKPGDPGHAVQVAQLAADSARLLGGRTLVLTTTLHAMRTIGEQLQSHFDASKHVEVLVQGQSPKRRLMERFREGAGDGRAGCVLVASASFWEGFDVPGDALQLVIIDKLPFPPPGDPLFEARSQRVTREGRSAFADHALPEAAVALKQGAGRLIRSEADRGVLVVCDKRLTSMSYGRRLIRGLPEMRRLSSDAEFQAALLQLTTDATSSTTF